MLSRVADSLYWMSRYLERAEHTARLLTVHLNLALDQSPALAEQHWQRLLASLHITPPEDDPMTEYSITELVIFEQDNDNSIVHCIVSARENARHVREMISSEMWEQLNRLYLRVWNTGIDVIWNAEPYEFLRDVRDSIHLFDGITDSTMNHGEGWDFIQAGRYIERASTIARLLDVHSSLLVVPDIERDDYMEWVGLLKCCTAFEAYCKIYTADLEAKSIVEFLLLNDEFPHTIGFAISRLQVALDSVAEETDRRKAIRANRLVGKLRAALSFDSVEEIMAGGLHVYLADIQDQCMQVHNAIQQTYVSYPIELVLEN
ncbi:MAG: alpha-E domain-containing protein [Anaerolineae bacterium]|nr:alpha-E domain-containing protein [Anaerolineae bacterium]